MAGHGPCSKLPKQGLSSDPVGEVGAISDDDIQSLLKEHAAAHEAANRKLLADVAVLVDKKTAKIERTQLQHAERLERLSGGQAVVVGEMPRRPVSTGGATLFPAPDGTPPDNLSSGCCG